MSPIDNINSGMENLTLIGLRKFNLSGQEFDINNFPKFVEFEPDNSTKTGNLSINVSKRKSTNYIPSKCYFNLSQKISGHLSLNGALLNVLLWLLAF